MNRHVLRGSVFALLVFATVGTTACRHVQETAVSTRPRDDQQLGRAIRVITEGQLREDDSYAEKSLVCMSGDLAMAVDDVGRKRGAEARVVIAGVFGQLVLGDRSAEIAAPPVLKNTGEICFEMKREHVRIAVKRTDRFMDPPLRIASLPPLANVLPKDLLDSTDSTKPPEFQFVVRLVDATLDHQFTVHLPDGHAAVALPKDVDFVTGQAFVKRKFTQAGNVVKGTFTFSSVSLTQHEALFGTLKSFIDDEADANFQVAPLSRTLWEQKRGVDAFRESARLVAAHPQSPYCAGEYARTLLRLGLVDAARAQAEATVRLAPKLPFSHRVLAETLEVDKLGRSLTMGYPRQLALEARRRDLALGSRDQQAGYHLARLLSFDERGRWLEDTSTYDEILALTKEPQELFSEDAAVLRGAVLLRQRRWQEAQTAVKGHLDRRTAASIHIAGLLEARGAEVAFVEARRIGGSGPFIVSLLAAAGDRLFGSERFDGAAALFAEAARLDPRFDRQATVMEALRKAREIDLDPTGPKGALHVLQQACLTPESFRGSLSMVDPKLRAGRAADDPSLYREVCGIVVWGIKGVPLKSQIEQQTAHAKEVTGAAKTGYRVTYVRSRATDLHRAVYFSASSEGPRLVGQGIETLAGEALALAKRGDLKAAVTWLNWADEQSEPMSSESVRTLPVEVLNTLWGATERASPTSATVALAAAAVYAFRPPAASTVLPALRAAYQQKAPPARKRAVGIALTAAYGVANAKEGADFVEALGIDDEADRRVVRNRLAVLLEGATCERVKPIVERWVARQTSQVEALRLRVRASLECSPDLYVSLAQQLMATGREDVRDRNALAWHMAGRGINLGTAVENARAVVGRVAGQDMSYLNTLAFALAANGEVVEARSMMDESLTSRVFGNDGRLEDASFLVLGMIAEKVGLSNEAIRIYKSIPKPTEHRSVDETWDFAQLRLQKLGSTPI